MRLLALFTIAYSVLGLLFVWWARGSLELVGPAFVSSISGSLEQAIAAAWIIPVFAIYMLLAKRAPEIIPALVKAGASFLLCAILAFVFIRVKTAMPLVVPMWADPLFAIIDRVLHGGIDPWRITHSAIPIITPDIYHFIYVGLWLGPAIFFPVPLILLEKDPVLLRRTLILFMVSWVFVGNILALAFMSAGPVFYDQVVGGERFAELLATLKATGITDSKIGDTQRFLWHFYATNQQALGSGISAFPSVHISVATVVCAHVAEKRPGLTFPMFAILGVYTVLSVHLGYHYAIDGYFSIVAILALRGLLVSRERRRSQTVPVPIAAEDKPNS